MPDIYVEREFTLKVAQDANFQRKHFQLEDHSQTYSSLTYASDFRRDIGVSATVNVDLGGITTGMMLFVETSATLTVQVDSESVTVAPIDTGGKGILYFEGSFTSVSLVNPSGTASISEVSWALAGV